MNVKVVNLLDAGRPQYRLGDAVLKRDASYGRAAFDFIVKNQCWFDGSILYDYASRINRTSSDPQWHVLRKSVARKTLELKLKLPEEDELVVHLRLGSSKGFSQAAETLVDYIEGLTRSIDVQVSLVTIVTAVHFGKTYLVRNKEYQRLLADIDDYRELVGRILGFFKARNINAKLYSHENIDKDFCYLSNARLLVLGNGHFSLCAAMLSDGVVFVPPWARQGTDIDIDELLNQRTD